MSVTVNLPGNIGDPAPIQTDVTKAAAKDKYVGLKNAPATWASNAQSIYVGRSPEKHQPASWKVN